METSPFVERNFEADGDIVVCRFFMLQPEPTKDYSCLWQITWPRGEMCQFRIYGFDAVQALLLAMRSAHKELIASEAYRTGLLTYLGERDLGLPPPADPLEGEI